MARVVWRYAFALVWLQLACAHRGPPRAAKGARSVDDVFFVDPLVDELARELSAVRGLSFTQAVRVRTVTDEAFEGKGSSSERRRFPPVPTILNQGPSPFEPV